MDKKRAEKANRRTAAKKENQYALNRAVYDGAWDRVLAAVIGGADPQDKPARGDHYSALHHAIDGKRYDMAEALLTLGADPNYVADLGLADYVTPLHVAVFGGDLEMAELLLNKGAYVDLANGHDGRTALFLAAEIGDAKIVDLLLEKGADPNLPDRTGQTALHQAVRNGDEGIIMALLNRGADATIADEHKITPQTMARKQGNHAVAALLSSIESTRHR